MKKYNKFLNILNILVLIEIIALNSSIDVAMTLYIYKTFMIMLKILCLLIAILNIVSAIVNFRKNNKDIAMMQSVIGLFITISLIINQRIISIILSIVTSFLCVAALKINKKSVEEDKSKISTILFTTLGSLQILVFIIPIIMNAINLNNLKKVLSVIETQMTVKTKVKKEKDEYIFFLKNGKEYCRAQFDEMYINENNNELYGMILNGNRLEVGVARNGNKVVVINTQGKEIFHLCNIFENYQELTKKFMYYIGQTHKYEIQTIKSENVKNIE